MEHQDLMNKIEYMDYQNKASKCENYFYFQTIHIFKLKLYIIFLLLISVPTGKKYSLFMGRYKEHKNIENLKQFRTDN